MNEPHYAHIGKDGFVLTVLVIDHEQVLAFKEVLGGGQLVGVHHDDPSAEVGVGWFTPDGGVTWEDRREAFTRTPDR